MEIKLIKIEQIKPYEKNAKQHPKIQIEKIKNSIKEFGFNVPLIIDKDNIIIAGHGRYIAAQELEMKELPCIQKSQLTKEQVKAFRIADNKIAESDWIDDFLKSELSDLKLNNYNLINTGFSNEELEKLFNIEKSKIEIGEIIYEISIECDDEKDQQKKYDVLTKGGYKCRVLTL